MSLAAHSLSTKGFLGTGAVVELGVERDAPLAAADMLVRGGIRACVRGARAPRGCAECGRVDREEHIHVQPRAVPIHALDVVRQSQQSRPRRVVGSDHKRALHRLQVARLSVR